LAVNLPVLGLAELPRQCEACLQVDENGREDPGVASFLNGEQLDRAIAPAASEGVRQLDRRPLDPLLARSPAVVELLASESALILDPAPDDFELSGHLAGNGGRVAAAHLLDGLAAHYGFGRSPVDDVDGQEFVVELLQPIFAAHCLPPFVGLEDKTV